MEKKIKLGQFFTKESSWLKPHVKEFILNSGRSVAYDPFAGGGDLLKVCQLKMNFTKIIGLDIDKELGWKVNDSLIKVPFVSDSIIVTNPPYLAKQSATRKKIDLSKYFENTNYDDLYLLALEKMVEANDYIVVIIPESFINSNFKNKNLIYSITILEENPFTDTENPVCVVCFDGVKKDYKDIKIYKNDKYLTNFAEILKYKQTPLKNLRICFNDLNGWIGLRAIDSTDDNKKIKFDFKNKINYDWDNKINVSSRHFSLIYVEIDSKFRESFLQLCNEKLNKIREKTHDLVLTPFKGNTKSGIRRRRLDFKMARLILEQAYDEIVRGNNER